MIGECDYFRLSNLFTKCRFASATTPGLRMARFLFVLFLVRMWRLNAFWKVILPVPVTLKRFFALELVFTFGMLIKMFVTPCWRPERTGTYGALWEIIQKVKNFSGGKGN